MHRQALAEREMFFSFTWFFAEGGDIGGRRFRGIVKNDAGEPRAASDGLGALGTGGHRHDGGIGDDSAIASVLHGDAMKGQDADLTFFLFSNCAELSIGVLQMT